MTICDPERGCPPSTHNLHCGAPDCAYGRAQAQKAREKAKAQERALPVADSPDNDAIAAAWEEHIRNTTANRLAVLARRHSGRALVLLLMAELQKALATLEPSEGPESAAPAKGASVPGGPVPYTAGPPGGSPRATGATPRAQPGARSGVATCSRTGLPVAACGCIGCERLPYGPTGGVASVARPDGTTEPSDPVEWWAWLGADERTGVDWMTAPDRARATDSAVRAELVALVREAERVLDVALTGGIGVRGGRLADALDRFRAKLREVREGCST